MSKRSKKEKGSPRAEVNPPVHSVGDDDVESAYVLRHVRIGWWSLLLFLSLGIALEGMHGFKVQWYLGDQNATRRLMFTLAHVHGTLLSLVHLGLAATLYMRFGSQRFPKTRSNCLSLATILMPLGFFAGGWNIHDGDPGLGVLLVPFGAVFLFVSVLLTALSTLSSVRSAQ